FTVHPLGSPIVLTTDAAIASPHASPPTLQGQWVITNNGVLPDVDNIIVSWSYATVSITTGSGGVDGGNNFQWIFSIPIVASWTIDKDNNGRIDTIRVQVRQTTQLASNAFGGIVVKVDGYGTISGPANFSFPVGEANKDVFDIALPEGPSEDTSATPTWQILSNTSLKDQNNGAIVQHNTPSSTFVYTASKGARPVIT